MIVTGGGRTTAPRAQRPAARRHAIRKTPMIIVHGTIPIRADRRDEALQLMRWMEDSSRIEDGCLTYEFFVGLSDPNTLLLFQEWESAEALAQHFDTEHMERFLEKLPKVLDGKIHTRRYAVEVDGEQEIEVEEAADDDDLPATAGPRDEKPIIH
jgi:quinol monooxygenase YgiN